MNTVRSISVISVALAWLIGACDSATGPDPVPAEADGVAAARSLDPVPQAAIQHSVELFVEGQSFIIGWCDESAGLARVLVSGVGRMPHIGRFRTEQTACNSLVTGQITAGEAILFAANGDQLHMTWSGRVVPGVVPQTLELTYVTYGGTGRFISAQGETDFLVVYSSKTDWTAHGSGWLSYEASDGAHR